MSYRVLTAMPVYNEQSHVVDVMNEVRQYSQDMLVVDDGSTDRTPFLLAAMEGVDMIRHGRNRGYGAALRSAFQFAIAHDYDILVTIDCDGQHQPRLIPELAAQVFPEDDEPWDIISGSRYLETLDGNSIPPVERRRINVEICRQLHHCFGLELTDAFCGFKAYRVEALRQFNITEPGYAMPLQLWIQTVRHKMRVKEHAVPLVYLDEKRSFGGSLDDAQKRLSYYEGVIRREMEVQNVPCGAAD